MDTILLNGVGFVASLGAIAVVAKTLIAWKGVLREKLYFLLYGFIFFGFGFSWNIFYEGLPFDSADTLFFSIGMILIVWGSNQIFSFTYGSQANQAGGGTKTF